MRLWNMELPFLVASKLTTISRRCTWLWQCYVFICCRWFHWNIHVCIYLYMQKLSKNSINVINFICYQCYQELMLVEFQKHILSLYIFNEAVYSNCLPSRCHVTRHLICYSYSIWEQTTLFTLRLQVCDFIELSL